MQCDRSLCAPRSRLILWHSVCFIGAAFLAMVWFGAARAAEDVRPAASPAAPPAAAPAVPRDAANPPARPGPPGKRAPAPPDSAALEADLLRAYLPKADLGVDRFLAAHPDADGRGVIVAILDTGVDLRQPGLLTTPTGDRKILDVYDATDNGLVELSTVRKTADSTLAGMTGRTLRLGAHRADDGLYRLGLLRGAELFPGGLEDRILSDRRIERERLIANWENQVAEGPRDRHEAEKDSTAPPDRERTYKELRREADRDFQDPGPAYDLVAFKKSGAWTLVVDVNGDGKLRDDIELLPYGKRADVAVFPPPASLSIALSTIAGDGSSASLFFDQGGHGTHVAGIVGAYYGPDDPLNGLAPGVRFLAIKIGNGRFGGSTSHNSMAKGLDWAIRHGAMVANASFGGTSWFENGQEITSKFFDQMVQDHGIFISVSAGNEGPGLSTVGSPGTARRAFTMGAAISPWTMLASYGGLTAEPGLLPKRNAPATEGIRLFPFSSRGPLANGSPGVDFVSPGAALSTLPTWLLTRNENWNGTSMAAPQAAGCLALLLSACMQEGVPVSPPRMDRAMRAAAAPLAGVPWVEQGAGLIQVPETFEALRGLARAFPVEFPGRAAGASAGKESAPADSAQVPGVGIPATRDPVAGWRIRVANATGEGEGYYERDLETTDPYWKTFEITPDLPQLGANPVRLRFSRVVRLESTVPWMEAPPQMAIPASGTAIRVRFDPKKMGPGLNVGRIRVLDVAAATTSGPVAAVRAPGSEAEFLATVIRPETTALPDYRLEQTFALPAGEREAVFLKVPEGATRLKIRMREETAEPANSYTLAATAISVLHPPSALRDVTYLSLRREQEQTFYQRVEPGTTIEIVLFARWVNTGPGRLRALFQFDGLTGPAGLGSTAQLNGEQGPDARWGERPILFPSGRNGAVVPVRALLKTVDADVASEIHGTAEPLQLAWKVRPDSLYTHPLDRETPVILIGTGWVRLDGGESVTVDLREAPEFEDLLDDAFVRMFDPNGALVASANISNGPFPLAAPTEGPQGGAYRLEFSIFSQGRAFIADWSIFAPEVIRGGASGELTLFPDPVAGQTSSADSASHVTLLRGQSQPLYLRARGVPEGKALVGAVEFDDVDDAPALLHVPLRIETRPEQPDADESRDAAIADLERPARRLLTIPPSAGSESSESAAGADSAGVWSVKAAHPDVAAALSDLDRAEALLRAAHGDDYETSDEAWDVLFLRTDVLLRHGLRAGAAPAANAGRHGKGGKGERGGKDDKDGKDDSKKHGEAGRPASGAVTSGVNALLLTPILLADDSAKQLEDLLTTASTRLEAARKETAQGRTALEKRKEPSGDIRTVQDLADAEARLDRLEGRVEYRRARLALERGDTAGTQDALTKAAAHDFGGEDSDLVMSALLAAQGKPLDAIGPATRAAAADPWNTLLETRVIELELALGWVDLASERLQAWPARYPERMGTAAELLARLRAARVAPEVRGGAESGGTLRAEE